MKKKKQEEEKRERCVQRSGSVVTTIMRMSGVKNAHALVDSSVMTKMHSTASASLFFAKIYIDIHTREQRVLCHRKSSAWYWE